MSNIEKPVLNKIEHEALKKADIQTLRLIKEIRTLREQYGTHRAKHIRQKRKAEELHQAELRNTFAKAVGAVRKVVPSLPPLTIYKDTLTVTLYQGPPGGEVV